MRKSLITYQERKDEIPKETIAKVLLPIKSVSDESIHEDDQVMNDPSIKYKEFELSCNDHIGVFNKLDA